MNLRLVVLDTNVLVSALIRPFGPPGKIWSLVLAGEIVPVYDDRILAEWSEVLSRDKFGFPPGAVGAVLFFTQSAGLHVSPSMVITGLPDPDDDAFLEVVSASAATLITGNIQHYPPERRKGVPVVEPREFLDLWADEQ